MDHDWSPQRRCVSATLCNPQWADAAHQRSAGAHVAREARHRLHETVSAFIFPRYVVAPRAFPQEFARYIYAQLISVAWYLSSALCIQVRIAKVVVSLFCIIVTT